MRATPLVSASTSTGMLCWIAGPALFKLLGNGNGEVGEIDVLILRGGPTGIATYSHRNQHRTIGHKCRPRSLTSEESLHHQPAYPALVRITNDQPTKAYHTLSVVPEFDLPISLSSVVEQHTHSNSPTFSAGEIESAATDRISVVGVTLRIRRNVALNFVGFVAGNSVRREVGVELPHALCTPHQTGGEAVGGLPPARATERIVEIRTADYQTGYQPQVPSVTGEDVKTGSVYVQNPGNLPPLTHSKPSANKTV